MWILLQADEDGNPVNVVPDIKKLMDSPEDYGVTSFKDEDWFRSNPDPNYWRERGTSVLLYVDVVVPEPVTAKWALPNDYPYVD